MRGPASAALLAGVLLLESLATGQAAATHGGPEVGSLLDCSRPVEPPRCVSVANDRWHHVYIDPSVPAALAAAVRHAIADYDTTALVVIEQPRPTAVTDITVFAADHGANGAAGWVNCPAQAAQGINRHGDRWCRGQELHFNLNARYAAYFADEASRDYMACHELGHSVGLRHWGNPPRSDGPAAETCMQPDVPNGPTQLHAFDREHLDAYYATPPPARRAPPLSGLRRDADLRSRFRAAGLAAY
jgi:hypothetical protein